ncbi:MAG: transglycosylase domain-containing protein [Bacteroidales bacterium]|nr:transglycosylase domain-containing protein [Bacteroidales bacterium]
MNINISSRRKFVFVFWALILSPIIVVTTIFILAGSGSLGYMPKIEDLENPNIELATLIYDDNSEVLGSISYKNRNRTFIQYDQLPQHLVDALIATEDVRFYRHSGIDFKGTARAVILYGILRKKSAGGGSTITQQLAKLLFHEHRSRQLSGALKQKFKEYIIAVKLEKAYTKEEIIALYFNQYDYLYNSVGIQTASRTYFNVNPDSLSLEQAATLVGMAKNPILYNPKRNPNNSTGRRNVVLSQMKKYEYISPEVCDSLQKLPLKLDFNFSSHNVGLATYFREYIKWTLSKNKPLRKEYNSYKKYREDSLQWAENPIYGWCNKHKKPDGSNYDIFQDGLRIHTTINTQMQYFAEKAVKKHLTGLQEEMFKEKKGKTKGPFSDDLTNSQINNIIKHSVRWSERGKSLHNKGMSMNQILAEFKKPVDMTIFTWDGEKDTNMSPLDSILYYKHFLHTGMMAMQPGTGHVKAYVGGLNYKYFQYDHVIQGKRQAGSTFKPFLYILAMQEGYSPCQKVPVAPISFYDPYLDTVWMPKTTGNPRYIGTEQTLKWGLAKSENYISAWLVDRFKPQPIADIAYRMGIESKIDPVPSMIYGTSDMSVHEMVGAYGTFVNRGIHVKPIFITKIEDKYGNLLASFIPETKESISENTAYLMLELLKGVTNIGTAYKLRSQYEMTAELAGKTGTTNDHADGWYMGIAPNLVTGVWVGAEERSVHFNSTLGYGGNMALPIWADFMQNIYADSTLGITQADRFEKPLNFNLNLDCDAVNKPSKFQNFGSDDDFINGI